MASSEDEQSCEMIENAIEETTEKIESMEEETRATKRIREERSSGEWERIENKKLRMGKEFKSEVIIRSPKEKLPKQFAMANLLSDLGFHEITKVKYINPYKIRVEIPDSDTLGRILDSQEFKNRGWLVHRAGDINITYGIIRNVDLELKDEEALNVISCPDQIKIISFKRLKRRGDEGQWVPSEVARIAFNSGNLPAYVCVKRLCSQVEPYVFPVTQCSRCWKFGHAKSLCNSKKIVCPKCGNFHENCEVTNYRCVNCLKNHMALDKSCPAFLREKRIRELMSEFNCSYRSACKLYVHPDTNNTETIHFCDQEEIKPSIETYNRFSVLQSEHDIEREHVYTPILSDFPPLPQPKHRSTSPVTKQSKLKNTKYAHATVHDRPQQHTDAENCSYDDFTITEQLEGAQGQSRSNATDDKFMNGSLFSELFSRIKDILFIKNLDVQQKCSSIIKCLVEWLIIVSVEYMSKWPFLKCIIEVLSSFCTKQ